MQAILLAAGLGTRLAAVSSGRIPKALVKVGGESMITRIIKQLRSNGIRDITVVTGHEAEQMHTALADHHVHFVHDPDFADSTKDQVFSLWCARGQFLRDDTIISWADLALHHGIIDQLCKLGGSLSPMILVDHRFDLETVQVVALGDRVVRIRKGLCREESTGTFLGLSLVPKIAAQTFVTMLDEVISRGDTQQPYSVVFDQLASKGGTVLCDYVYGLPWVEVDTPEDLEEAKRIVSRLRGESDACQIYERRSLQ